MKKPFTLLAFREARKKLEFVLPLDSRGRYYAQLWVDCARVQRKRPGTIENERQAIVRWRSHLGHLRIDKITTPMITGFLEKRLKGGAFGGRKLEPVSQRTANLDLMTLRNVLKAAIDDG